MQSCPSEGDGYVLTESPFYLASPNYPYPYDAYSDCYWYIAPQDCSSGQRVQFDLEYLNTVTSGSDENCDHPLVIGPVNGTHPRFCGYLKNFQVLTDNCFAFVHLDARAPTSNPSRGFYLSYSGECTLIELAAHFVPSY